MSAVDANPRRQLMWACPRRRLHAVAALPSYMHNRTRACESGVVRGRQAHGGRSRLHRSFSSRLETTSQAMHSGLSRHAIDRNAMPTTFQIISIRVSASQISESMCSERFLMREGLTVQIPSSSEASEEARKASRWRSNRCRSTGKHRHRQNAYAALGCRIVLAMHSGKLGKDGRSGGAILQCVRLRPCDRCC